MAKPETLEKVKQAIRRTHSVLDADLMADIDACLADLTACGVEAVSEDDPQVYHAIKLFCKASDTDDPAKGAEYLRRYDALKASLMMDSDRGAEEVGADG